MPMVSDEEYQQFQAWRSGAGAQQQDQQRAQFDAAAPADPQSGAPMLQSAYQQQSGYGMINPGAQNMSAMQQATAGAYGAAAPDQSMQTMQSRQEAEAQANSQQGASQAPPAQPSGNMYARRAPAAGGFGAPADQNANANAANESRQRAMQTATSNAWGA